MDGGLSLGDFSAYGEVIQSKSTLGDENHRQDYALGGVAYTLKNNLGSNLRHRRPRRTRHRRKYHQATLLKKFHQT